MEKKGNRLARVTDEDNNPCLEEAGISVRCLERNMYVRENCKKEYDNYNQCKKFWAHVRSKRKSAGITPHLPTKEERDKIVELRSKGIHVTSVS